MDKDKIISGVTCDVQTCLYHCNDRECKAGEIRVGPHKAETSSDTICATFKSKETY